MLKLIAILALIVIGQSALSSTKWTLPLLIGAVLIYCFPLLILVVALTVAGVAYFHMFD